MGILRRAHFRLVRGCPKPPSNQRRTHAGQPGSTSNPRCITPKSPCFFVELFCFDAKQHRLRRLERRRHALGHVKTCVARKPLIESKPVTFEYKDPSEGKGPQIGLIAQDVEKVYPGVVITRTDGMKGIDYSKFAAPLIKAVQEQQAEIQDLKDQNISLTQRIVKLEAAK